MCAYVLSSGAKVNSARETNFSSIRVGGSHPRKKLAPRYWKLLTWARDAAPIINPTPEVVDHEEAVHK